MNDVYLILLGSILALATSFLVEIYKDWSKNKNLLKNFKTVLKLESKNLVNVVDKLTEGYSSKNYYPIKVIDQIDRNLTRMESIRKDTIYLKEENKKGEILNYINDMFVLSSDLRSVENYAFNNPENENLEDKRVRMDFSTRERQMIALRIVDLKRRGQDVVNYLEN